MTASALVQRFGSKRELMLAHWRQAAAGGGRRMQQDPRARSPLNELRATAALFAKLAVSPRAALRNLAYMQSDWADRAFRPHVLRHARAARAHYEQLVADAVTRGELRADTDTPDPGTDNRGHAGWFIPGMTLYREGPAAKRFREDLDTTLRPYLARGVTRSPFERTTVDAKANDPEWTFAHDSPTSGSPQENATTRGQIVRSMSSARRATA